MKRRFVQLAAAILLAYVGFGLWVRGHRAPRPAPPAGEIRGAYHVHTTRSDGRGSLDEVVRAAREAGLQFLVVTDHNVMHPEEAGYRDGVLVVEGSEVSAPYGHIVGLGLQRELTKEERQKDTIGNIRALGGEAMIAHPFHPKRPFTRWIRQDWLGFEVVSNDTFWGATLAERDYGRIAVAALELPWDEAQAALAFYHEPERELARYDELLRVQPAPQGASRAPRHPLLCAADAHGWPSYRGAFEAFSMHLPVPLSGDASADARRVIAALTDGTAFCVLDGVAPGFGVRLSLAPGGDRLDLAATTDDPSRASFTLVREGAAVGAFDRTPSGWTVSCGGPCPRRTWYRVEGRYGGRPWVFTNPVWIE